MRRQEPPFAIQIELTEGCNLGCQFCGLRGIRKKGTTPLKFMSKKTAMRIADQIARSGWNSRIIFSMHGEPTLNPNYLAIIKHFRKRLPNAKLSMMTNCFGIVHGKYKQPEPPKRSVIRERVKLLAKAGLNDLICDYYVPKGDAFYVEKSVTSVDEFNVQYLGKGVPLYSASSKAFRVLFNPPIQNNPAINRHLCNHCGAAGPLDKSWNDKRCARPFRELTFRYDGWTALCCNDFRGEYPVGNIHEKTIEQIWYSKRFEAARKILMTNNRGFKPCDGCNALSHRVGLLPDKKGQEAMPNPTDMDWHTVEAVAGISGPLAEIVRRPWEDETE